MLFWGATKNKGLAFEEFPLPIHNLLSLEAKVEDEPDVARGGDHEGEILLADVGEQAHQETLAHTHTFNSVLLLPFQNKYFAHDLTSSEESVIFFSAKT